ncbi:DUF4190 domain-containing protein [Zhihengliuella flava]|uniref:DUF4190 domain-containing protein n=1 Tax=Zhihengliuella flava TaxID=1285193 RepID=A0A931DBD2_9MICC|nr:DUF4190 domain-containing protein [Zhihengliuella flava]MBG6084421.1 hypothetical protein [Zhihengliuella flava]
MSTPQSGASDPQQPHQHQPGAQQPGQQPGTQQPGYHQYGYPQHQPGPQYPQAGAAPAGPYGHPGAGYPAGMRPTNTFAIISLVSSFFIAVVGIVFGHLARKQIRETGEAGDGLAIAGLIIGYVHLGFWIVFGLMFLIPLFMMPFFMTLAVG